MQTPIVPSDASMERSRIDLPKAVIFVHALLILDKIVSEFHPRGCFILITVLNTNSKVFGTRNGDAVLPVPTVPKAVTVVAVVTVLRLLTIVTVVRVTFQVIVVQPTVNRDLQAIVRSESGKER